MGFVGNSGGAGLTQKDKNEIEMWMVSGHSAGGATGTIPIANESGNLLTPGASDLTIDGRQYLSDIVTIAGDNNLTSANIRKGSSIFGVTGNYGSTFGVASACSMGEIYDSSGGKNSFYQGVSYKDNALTARNAHAQTGTFVIQEPGDYEIQISGICQRYENGSAVSGIKLISGGQTIDIGRKDHGSISDYNKFAISFFRSYNRYLKKGDQVYAYSYGRNDVYNFGYIQLLLKKST